jgi:hypothetical protein
MSNTRFINVAKAMRLMHSSIHVSSLMTNIINPRTGKIIKARIELNPAISINYNCRRYPKDVFCRGMPEHPTTLEELELDSPNVVPIRQDGVLLGAYYIMGGVIK